MIRLYIVVEGQTEEAFVNDVLGPRLYPRGVYPSARLIGRPGHKGGNVSYARLKNDVSLLLKQDQGAFCTTLIDFYALGDGFPGNPPPPNIPNIEKVRRIEQAVMADIIDSLGEHRRADARFLPYLQLHEYEGLLFSDPAAFATGIYHPHLLEQFQNIRAQFPTPEDINDDPLSAPSKRVLRICPDYNKPLYGTLAALSVGIDAMRRECPHFKEWFDRLETLAG